jgi:hypothetical protein
LINANVFLRADAGTLSLKDWPESIRNDPSSLNPCAPSLLSSVRVIPLQTAPDYERAEQMLEPSPYPTSAPELHKLTSLEKQAARLGKEANFSRAPQTTRWSAGRNAAGVEMRASALEGQDTTGSNDGAKNSVLVTYLADAWSRGAEMYVFVRPHLHVHQHETD